MRILASIFISKSAPIYIPIFIIIIVSSILISACTPVRPNYFSGKKEQPPQIADEAVELEPLPAEEKPGRFSDTTIIELPTVYPRERQSLADLFNTAVTDFDNEVYDEVCGKFDQFAGTISEGDSLYFESLFYKSECEIVNNNLTAAEGILYYLQSKPDIPPAVLEKTSIRLGQVYCVMKLSEKANKQFSRFKKLFPNSIYSSLANCAAVQY